MINLRDYQLRAEAELKAALQIYRRVLLVLPTGGGKGILIAHVIYSCWMVGKRVVFNAHRQEILDQVSRHLVTLGVPHGPGLSVQLWSVQTLARRMDRLPLADVVLMDEIHHAAAKTWLGIIRAYSDSLLVGFTATPYRTDGTGLGNLDGHGFGFQWLVCVAQIHELIEQGWLVPPRVYAPSEIDLSKVGMVAGDYNMKDAGKLLNKPKITGDIVANWKKYAEGRPTIVFTTGLTHSADVTTAFNAAGVKAEDVDGTSKDRTGPLARFTAGETMVLINVGVYTEGTDLPNCSAIVMARPTTSPGLNRQMTGRSLRMYPGKESAVIVDSVGNVLRHGMPDWPEQYTLLGREKRNKEAVPSVTVCRLCFAAYASKLPTCPSCGAVKPEKPRAPIKVVEGELVEVGAPHRIAWGRLMPEDERVAFLAKKIEEGRERGYKSGWPGVQFNVRVGRWPSSSEQRKAAELIEEQKKKKMEVATLEW